MSESGKRKTLLDSFVETDTDTASVEASLPVVFGTQLSRREVRQFSEMIGTDGFALLVRLLGVLQKEIVEETLEAGRHEDSFFYRLQGIYQLAKEIENMPEVIAAAGPLTEDDKQIT